MRTKALPPYEELRANNPSIQFFGSWTSPTEESRGRVTQQAGDSLMLSFDGTGVAWIAQKTEGAGSAEVLIDGMRQETLHLAIKNLPTLPGVTVFQKDGMSRKQHTVKIMTAGNGPVNIEAMRVYS